MPGFRLPQVPRPQPPGTIAQAGLADPGRGQQQQSSRRRGGLEQELLHRHDSLPALHGRYPSRPRLQTLALLQESLYEADPRRERGGGARNRAADEFTAAGPRCENYALRVCSRKNLKTGIQKKIRFFSQVSEATAAIFERPACKFNKIVVEANEIVDSEESKSAAELRRVCENPSNVMPIYP